jgi:TM2 domain-containing membrane protein YozV
MASGSHPPFSREAASSGLSPDAEKMLRYDANKKSVAAAYVLWLFLGCAGAHRFYLGATGSGATMLFILVLSAILSGVGIGLIGFVVVGIWALIDAILIPGMASDHNNRLISSL